MASRRPFISLEGVVLAVRTQKFMVWVLLLAAVVCSALPAMAWDPAKQKNLGQDHVKMQWYLLDYGTKGDGSPFAVARKYYTNESVKQQTIDLLMSKFGYSPEVAGSLYFTEYEYEYTKDGKQFAVTYLRHYDMLGNEIHGTVYDDSSEAAKKVYAAVDANSTPGKGLALAAPKSAPKPAPAKKKK
jgi:hypothetical protein